MARTRARLWIGVALALSAFAANSILCRLALAEGAIDPASFTTVRVAAGALVLAIVARVRSRRDPGARSQRDPGAHSRRDPGARAVDFLAALALFAYAILFSLAYVELGAGTGALLLFGAVQVTMIGVGLHAGERFTGLAWLGFAAALAGLVVLVLPGVTAPAPVPAACMALAGSAWGVYSLRGRNARDPLRSTALNFVCALPLALVVSACTWADARASARGVGLALASGAVTSGLGYVLWYQVLRSLDATRAATVQLAVPVLAAAGGILFLSEPLGARLVLASIAVLGGIALVLAQRTRRVEAHR